MAKTYLPDRVVVTFAGLTMQGYADGEFLTIENEADNFGDVVGTDGEVTRFRTNDRRATITIKLMQSSSLNEALSAIANADINTPNGAGVGAFYVNDLSGSSIYRSGQAWIQKTPDVSFGREAGSRDWVLRCDKLERTDGGN